MPMMGQLLHELSPHARQFRLREADSRTYELRIHYLVFEHVLVTAVRLRLLVHVAILNLLLMAIVLPELPALLTTIILYALLVSVLLTSAIGLLARLDPYRRVKTLGEVLGLLPYLTILWAIVLILKTLL